MRHRRLSTSLAVVLTVACSPDGASTPMQTGEEPVRPMDDARIVPELTTVERCGGTPTACAALTDADACRAQGCDWGQCSGGTTDCWVATRASNDLGVCEELSQYCEVVPSAWNPNTRVCQSRGASTLPCTALGEIHGACTSSPDCSWAAQPACTGTPTSCDGLDAQACAAVDGCRLATQDEAPCTGDCSCPAGSTRCGDRCIDTSSSAINCGSCGVQCAAELSCIEGRCSCVEGATETETCGINGRGSRQRECVGGAWGALSGCADPDVCVDGEVRSGSTPCGLNGRGLLEARCEAGQWQDTTTCLDADVCVDSEDVRPCGVFGTGTERTACEHGQWAEPVPCDDPVEHHQIHLPDDAQMRPQQLTAHDGALYYVPMYTNGSDGEVWRSRAGQPGEPLFAGTTPVWVSQLLSSPIGLFFSGYEGEIRAALWKSDGTSAGSERVIGFRGNLAALQSLTSAGGRVYFAGRDASDSFDPWVSDGTPLGTYPLAELFAEPISTEDFQDLDEVPRGFVESLGRVLFLAQGKGQAGSALWTADPLVRHSASALTGVGSPSPGFTDAEEFATLGDTALVAGAWYDPTFEWALQAVTPAGELEKLDDPAVWGTRYTTLRPYRDGVVFAASLPDQPAAMERALLYTDGTAAGTQVLAQGFETIGTVQVIADVLYFFAEASSDGWALWRSDDSASGTERLAGFSSNAEELVAHGDLVFFTGSDDAHGPELWVTDGTASGTRLVHDLAVGRRGSNPSEITAAGDHLYYVVDAEPPTRFNARQLWCTRVRRTAN